MALIEKLKNIANAIRSKTNKSEEMTLEQMASGVSEIDTLQGLDFDGVFDQEQANEINQYYKDGIAYAEEIAKNWSGEKFADDREMVFPPNIDYSRFIGYFFLFQNCIHLQFSPILDCKLVTNGSLESIFTNCYSLVKVSLKNTSVVSNFHSSFYFCVSLEEIDIDTTSATNLNSTFAYCYELKRLPIIKTDNISNLTSCFQNCRELTTLTLTSVAKCTIFSNTFVTCTKLENLRFEEWKQANIFISQSSKLSPESIHYIIQNAMDVADGATARTLTLHATAKTNWQNSEYYEQDLAVLEQKGITIA